MTFFPNGSYSRSGGAGGTWELKDDKFVIEASVLDTHGSVTFDYEFIDNNSLKLRNAVDDKITIYYKQ